MQVWASLDVKIFGPMCDFLCRGTDFLETDKFISTIHSFPPTDLVSARRME